ncbi:hypothetical protein LCGC14_2652520 [marine sediment metagenome]|uniref:Uncharacterized protein n=1 Tax=marine sediment metagenome TaxID=412755 RepID=A0A0F9AGQ3_9ZZZZ
MQNEKEKSNKVKAEIYFKNRWNAYVKLKPVGSLSCVFKSELIDNRYYEISKLNRERQPVTNDILFLIDIYDILPYKEIEE